MLLFLWRYAGFSRYLDTNCGPTGIAFFYWRNMQIPCHHCGKILNRPPSRVKANKQFCDKACYDASQVKRVQVNCSICDSSMEVHPSKAKKNKHFACSPTCESELSRRNRIAYFGSADERIATCENCGKQFERKPSQVKKYEHSFCCRSCKTAWQQGQEKPDQVKGYWYLCECCGKPVWRTPATLREHVFCSIECTNQAPHNRPINKINVPCAACGKILQRFPSRLIRSENMFCNRQCHAAWKKETMIGANNRLWKGGKIDEEHYGPQWIIIREIIRKRDNYTCQRCGIHQDSLSKALSVHHIVPFRLFYPDHIDAAHHQSNLVSLCQSCHRTIHNMEK